VRPRSWRPRSGCGEKFNTPDSGIHLLILENDLAVCDEPAFIEPVRAALDLRRNTPLSQAAMEVLAVIAYNQPVTKAFVEQVRGVDCSGVIGSLTLKGSLKSAGDSSFPVSRYCTARRTRFCAA
jgi:segregation and condensation protein B